MGGGRGEKVAGENGRGGQDRGIGDAIKSTRGAADAPEQQEVWWERGM